MAEMRFRRVRKSQLASGQRMQWVGGGGECDRRLVTRHCRELDDPSVFAYADAARERASSTCRSQERWYRGLLDVLWLGRCRLAWAG